MGRDRRITFSRSAYVIDIKPVRKIKDSIGNQVWNFEDKLPDGFHEINWNMVRSHPAFKRLPYAGGTRFFDPGKYNVDLIVNKDTISSNFEILKN